ncbi:glycosyltransferase family 2 protein [Paenibacillus sp. Soil522]|uniref:glycosyltransferase family 2 protein n=1 Tax=Paenibacillus sp. Soil522 TaxID=1736388 RepID=UPI0006F65AEF|nr:glycosyltransferase family 2 protein [Paenibacillus sp. Soil522]KRE51273.1 glycosyl transferase [Paenibacillus sp. Soil522]
MNETKYKTCKSISVVIIAQDEERRIVAAIRSCLPFADEIIVVDGGSRDATREVASALGCRILLNPWPGYAKQRNFGADAAKYDWVFFLDTDEFVDEALAASLLEWKSAIDDGGHAYAVYRRGNFLGKWLERGETMTRLYNRRVVRIRDTLVHEEPDIPHRGVRTLAGVLWHDGFRSIEDHVIRFNKYTELEARKAFYEKKQTFRLLPLLWRPPARFVQQYVLHGLYRKGLAGLTVAVMWVFYEYLRHIKLYELTRQQESVKLSDQTAKEAEGETTRQRDASVEVDAAAVLGKEW